MRREKLVCLLFLAVLGASLINIRYISTLSDNIINDINYAEMLAREENYDAALESISVAFSKWNKVQLYSGVFLRHPEIDSINDCFYELTAELLNQEKESLPAMCHKLIYHVRCIADMEKLKIGSILTCPEAAWKALP